MNKKRTRRIMLFVVAVMMVMLLTSSWSFAATYSKNFIKNESGTLAGKETLVKKFTLPAKSTVSISVVGIDDDDWDKGTEGAFYINIINSKGKNVFSKKDSSDYDDKKYTVKNLPKGEYTFVLGVDSNVDFYEDYKYDFEDEFEDEFEELYSEYYTDEDDYIDWTKYRDLWEEKYEEHFKKYLDENKELEYLLSAKYTVTEAVGASKIKLDTKTLALTKGKSKTLKAVITPSYVTEDTIWSSSNSKVATVSKKGKVTAKALGTATITAKNGKKKATCKVSIKTANKTIIRKQSSSLTSLVKNIKGYKNAKWSSSDKKIASITSSGKVTGKANGKCKIYCTINKVKYTINITVKDAASVSIYKNYDTSIYNETVVKVKNNAGKDITYMTLNITQYDNRGHKLKSPYSYYYYNDTLPAGDTYYLTYWTNDDTKKAKVKVKKIWFSDGSTWTP